MDPRELLDDPRVTLYWDERRVTGHWFDENVTLQGKRTGEKDRFEWDAFILYGHEAEWSESQPQSVSWGRPIVQEKERFRQDLEGALARAGD